MPTIPPSTTAAIFLAGSTQPMNFTKPTTTPFVEIYNRLSDNVKADLSANSDFWKRYDSKVAEVSGQINDHYLKANGQSDGIKSYDRMVDLMITWFRSK